jgi:hypothetical protein
MYAYKVKETTTSIAQTPTSAVADPMTDVMFLFDIATRTVMGKAFQYAPHNE